MLETVTLRRFGAAILAASTVFASVAQSVRAEGFGQPHDVLYVESNSTIPGQNAILGYRRAADGSLTPLPGLPFLTGGTGWFDPTYAVGPFDADGILAYDPVGRTMFVSNGGSKSVAALRVAPSGALRPVAGSPFAVAGNTPNSLALRGRTLVVVDIGSDPNQAGQSAAGYETARLRDDDSLVVRAGVLARGATLPTQALAVEGTPLLLTNEFFGGTISSYFLDLRGILHLIARAAPPQQAVEAAQPLPLGLAVNPVAPYVYAGLANVGRVGVYRLRIDGFLDFERSVAVSGAAPCWLYLSPDGRFLYVVNTADNSVSVMDARRPERPVEIQHAVLRGATGGSYQIAASPDGRFLYTLEEEDKASVAGTSNQIHVLAVDQRRGTLTETAASPFKLPVPAGNRPQGLLVF